MHIIVGLGNPGAQYERTRHNIGWMILDEIARRHAIEINKRQCEARIGSGFLAHDNATKILLAKPLTYMNLSGRSVQALLRFYNVEIGNLLIVTDDLNLPTGKLRLRAGGSDGGHNGLKSITQMLGTKEFARLRFGVGAPHAHERQERGTADFVLRAFDKAESDEVALSIQNAADCIEHWTQNGVESAMNRFNRVQ